MRAHLLRSAGAVAAACLIAIAAVALAPLMFLPVVERVSPAFLDAHAQIVFAVAYVFGTVLVALLAGAAVGWIAPGRPAVHMLSAAAVLEVGGLAIGGTQTLPHGWQVLGLGLQVTLACAVATLTWSRTHPDTMPALSRAI
jgi:hypothetical protein